MPQFSIRGRKIEYEGPQPSEHQQPILGAQALLPNSVYFQQLLSDPCGTHLMESAYVGRQAESEADRQARLKTQRERQAQRAEAFRAKEVRL